MKWPSPATEPEWPTEITNLQAKNEVAKRLANRLRDGDIVGAGSGSTSFLTLRALHNRAAEENLHFLAIPTSIEVAMACASWGIETTELYKDRPDWSFDGADEVDPGKRLIKGRGGALFSEKILMAASPEPYIVVDKTKLVSRLGSRHPIPVEVDPLAVVYIINELRSFKAITDVKIRTGQGKDGPVITERGNLLIDLSCEDVPDGLHSSVKLLPGVLETGIFENYQFELIVA